jgi:phosphoribosyl-AMP cyclohydrolase / phosphoribosyl-ATP pyrophosphohydrolase
MTAFDVESIDFAKGDGFVTVVTQDATTGQVLMVARANREAIERTIATAEMHYTSRTRGPWHKGATSGNTQSVVSLTADCDRDAVLARVIPAGPACHTGSASCFESGGWDVMSELDQVIASRAESPADGKSYTQRLLADRNLRLKKIGEEAAELAVACADADAPRAVEEAADLIYHTMVALRSVGASYADVERVLAKRHATSRPLPSDR